MLFQIQTVETSQIRGREPGAGEDFLNWSGKEKEINLALLKLKTSTLWNRTLRKCKRKSEFGRKYSQCINLTKASSRMHKERLQFNTESTNSLIKNQAKIRTDFAKGSYLNGQFTHEKKKMLALTSL